MKKDPRCDCVRGVMNQPGPHVPGCPAAVVYRTKTGKEMTNADMDDLVRQAERGYCTQPGPHTVKVRATPDAPWVEAIQGWCGKPLPCPIHGDDDA